CILASARASATKAPVIEAVRVPPSAWMTSQSTQRVRDPRTLRSATERSERPISLWISCVRPEAFPLVASRCVRWSVARGSIPYSEVIHPWLVSRRKGGTRSSRLAVQITCVLPTLMRAEPSAQMLTPVVISTGRMSLALRPSRRCIVAPLVDPKSARDVDQLQRPERLPEEALAHLEEPLRGVGHVEMPPARRSASRRARGAAGWRGAGRQQPFLLQP